MIVLIYHPFSPFSRIPYILAKERALTHLITLHKVVVCPVDPYPGWSDNNAEVAVSNPICKIPTLILNKDDPSSALFDSRVICEYLEHLASTASKGGEKGVERGSDLYFLHQTLLAATMGIMDAEVLCAYEDRIRKPEGILYQPWHDGMRVKVKRGLDFLDEAVRKGNLPVKGREDRVEVADIAVAVTCGFQDARGTDWKTGRDALKQYFDETWKGRRSWVETPVDKMWDIIEGKL